MEIKIRDIIYRKLGRKGKRVPDFIVKLLERIIHQNDINDILRRFSHLKDVEFITAVLNFLDIKRTVVGAENIIEGRKYIFASNHPLGGLDGFAVVEAVAERQKQVKILVNDLLMNITPLKGVFTPINKYGRQNVDYARQLSEVLASPTALIYFPAGLCSRKIDGKVIDLKWHKNFVNKAIETNRDIIPVHIIDENSTFFYIFAKVREWLGVKFNIELILLPSELFKKRGTGNVRIVFGAAITHDELTSPIRSTSKWCEVIRERCYSLK